MKKILLIILTTLLLLSGCSSDNKKSDINPDYVEGSYAIFENSTELYSPYDVFKTIETLMSVQPITYNRKDVDEYYKKQTSSIFVVDVQLMNMIVASNDNFMDLGGYFKVLNIGMINYKDEMQNKIENQFNAFNETKCYRDFILNDMSRICGVFLGKTINLEPYDVPEIFTPDYFKVIPGASYDIDKSNEFSPFKDKEQANTNNDEYLDNPNSAKPDDLEANDGEPMEYVPSEEELEEMEKIDEYNSSQESPYVKGQQLIVTSEKANLRNEPSLESKVVGYWIKDDVVTVYDYIFYEERWWIKTDPNKEWWVSERNLKVIDY